MGIFSSDTQTATASGGGSGGGDGLIGRLVAQAAAAAGLNSSKAATSEESPGNATNKRKGGKITASKRADGIAQRGKTRGKLI